MRALLVLVATANATTIVRELLSRHESKATYIWHLEPTTMPRKGIASGRGG